MSGERWVLCMLFDGPGWLSIGMYDTHRGAKTALTNRLNKFREDDPSRYLVVPESTYKAYHKLKDIIDLL